MKKFLSLFCALLWFSQALLHFLLLLGLPLGGLVFGGLYTVFPLWLRPVNFLLFVLWSAFGLAYLFLGVLLKKPLRPSLLKKMIASATVFLFLAAVFNFFISSSPLEKYLTGSLTALALLSSLVLLILGSKTPEQPL